MTVRLGPAAALELGAYRVAAGAARAVLAARMYRASGAEARVLAERLGRWQRAVTSDARPAIWVHAASLGETLTAAPLLARIRERCPQARIVLTCHTSAGEAAARRTAADEIHYFPIDTPSSLKGILASLRPRLFVFVETEIWPSLLLCLAERGVAAAMVSATVSEPSYRRYRRVRALISAALASVAAICARDHASLQRLLALGADPGRARVTGDLKSDALGAADVDATPDHLAALAVECPVLLAASTHPGEDEFVLDAFANVRARYPATLLVLAPRHPERAGAVLAAAVARGFATELWSEQRGARSSAGSRGSDVPPRAHGDSTQREPASSGAESARWDVLVIDTTGDLRGFMKPAAAVFVGGSLGEIGGHNLFEPAAFALPIATGPRLEGVRDQAEILAAADALAIVASSAALAGQWLEWLDAPAKARAAGEKARAELRSQGGALERTWSALVPLLERAGVAAREPDAVSR